MYYATILGQLVQVIILFTVEADLFRVYNALDGKDYTIDRASFKGIVP